MEVKVNDEFALLNSILVLRCRTKSSNLDGGVALLDWFTSDGQMFGPASDLSGLLKGE